MGEPHDGGGREVAPAAEPEAIGEATPPVEVAPDERSAGEGSLAERLSALREKQDEPRGGPPAGERRPGLTERLRGRRGAGASTGADEATGEGRWANARRRASDAWEGLPTTTRARLAAFAIAAAIAAIVLLVVLPAAPCGAPGGDECAPGDDAVAMLPDDTLAYAHLDVNPDSDQFEAARELSSRLPLLSRLAVSAVSNVAGARFDYATDVEPWAGGEVALALLPGSGRVERVVMIEADDEEAAREFADGLLGPGTSASEGGGAEISVAKGGMAATVRDGFLVLGNEDALASLGEASDDGSSLEDAAAAAVDELPDDRLAYGYLSETGARALLGRDPSLSSLDTFVDADASAGAAAALTVHGDAIDLAVRSELDPERAEASPNFFAALPQFEPDLTSDVGSDALAYLGLGDPASSVESLLGQAAVSAPALLGAFNRVEEDLRREGGVSLTDDLLPLLGSEAAVAVEPTGAKNVPQTPGIAAGVGVPYLSLIAEGVDAEEAAASLGRLQKPLIDSLQPLSTGKVPVFEEIEIAGVTAHSLPVNPDVELTYATYDDRLVVATNPLGIEQARDDAEALSDSEQFEEATATIPDEVSILAYLDLQDLLAIGEQIGLADDPVYATLRNLDAAAIGVDGSGEAIRTDVRVTVGEPEPVGADPSPVSGE